MDEPPSVFYRFVHSDPPTREDFVSNLGRGRLIPGDPDVAHLWDGISVNATEAQSRRRAHGMPALGGYIAELQIPDRDAIRVERTTRSAGHYTVWGEPEALLASVIRVVPVRPAEQG